ncbi:MAG: hypothetical protein ACO3RU_06920 [Planctomycetota bacterium]
MITASFGGALAAVRRSLEPSRLALGVLSVAMSVFGVLLLFWICAEAVIATDQPWVGDLVLVLAGLVLAVGGRRPPAERAAELSTLGPVPALVLLVILRHVFSAAGAGGLAVAALLGVGLLLAGSAIARVDLATLRGRAVPSPGEALRSAWAGWIPGLLPSLVLVAAAWLVMGLVEPWLGGLVGSTWIVAVPFGLLFFGCNALVLLFLPVAIWLALPAGAVGGDQFGATLQSTLAQVRRHPIPALLQHLVLVWLAALVFGLVTAVLLVALDITLASGFGVGLAATAFDLTFLGSLDLSSFASRAQVFLLGGALVALAFGLGFGPFLGALVCGACERVVDPGSRPAPGAARPPAAPGTPVHDGPAWWR